MAQASLQDAMAAMLALSVADGDKRRQLWTGHVHPAARLGQDCFAGEPCARRRHKGSVLLGAHIPCLADVPLWRQKTGRFPAAIKSLMQHRYLCYSPVSPHGGQLSMEARLLPHRISRAGPAADRPRRGTERLREPFLPMDPACHCRFPRWPERPYGCKGSRLPGPIWTLKGPWRPASRVHDGAADAVGFHPIP